MKGYIHLALSIAIELGATNLLKMANGFEHLLYFGCAIVGYMISFYFLALTLKAIPLSIAYAIWSGVGTVLTAIIGIVFWDELFTLMKGLGFALIIGGVIVLNFSEAEHEASIE